MIPTAGPWVRTVRFSAPGTVGGTGPCDHPERTSGWMLSLSFTCRTDGRYGVEKNGRTVGEQVTILHSVEGVISWNRQRTYVSEELLGVWFVSPAVGWVVGARGTILRTENGGELWRLQSSGTHAWLEDVRFT